MKTDFLNNLLKEHVPEDKLKEVVASIFAENGKDVDSYKTKLAAAETERDSYKDKAETAEKALKDFEDVDVEELKTKIKDLSKDLEDKGEEYKAELKKRDRKSAAEKYFADINFTSDLAKKAAMVEFESKELKLEEGKFLGADDFIEGLKKSNPAAFVGEDDEDEDDDDDEGKPAVFVKSTQKGKKSKKKKKMTLTEAMKYKNEHPEANIDDLI